MPTVTTTGDVATLAEIAGRLGVPKWRVRHAVERAKVKPVGRTRLRTHGGEREMSARLFRAADVIAAVEGYVKRPRVGHASGIRGPALTADGHEGRVALYAARVAAGERLFEPGSAAGRESPACLGCGQPARIGWHGLPDGWASRTADLCGTRVQELHCESCLRAWGWGDMA